MKLLFVSSRFKMIDELYHLWENEPLYKFINGSEYIRERELEICQCIPNIKHERDLFIEVTRCDYLTKDWPN